MRRTNRSRHTIINYHSDIKRFINWLEAHEKINLNNVRPRHISRYSELLATGKQNRRRTWINFWKKEELSLTRKLSVASRKRHISTIKNLYEFLVQYHQENNRWWRPALFRENPVKDKIHSTKLKEIDVAPTVVLNFDQWDKLKESCWRPMERFLVSILYFGGLRVDEARQLKWKDIDPVEGTIDLVRKGGKRHLLFLYKKDEVAKLYNNLKSSNDDDYIFPSQGGRPYNTRGFHQKVTNLIKRAGLKGHITPHSFRKGCATMLYLKTNDLLYVRDYLNHADAKITQTYIDKRVLEADRHIKRVENRL